MRVPQNIPLCKKIRVISTTAFGPGSTAYVGISCDDNQVPIWRSISSVTEYSNMYTVKGLFVIADKSYINYEPPKSYIVPTGYKPALRMLDMDTSLDVQFDSNGLGFICILHKVDTDNKLLVIDIVKK